MSLTSKELVRYSRHLRLPGLDPAAQERLKQSGVLVIGMGGLGSPAALYLAAAGVGRLGLADFDVVEAHNLQRQILHDTPSVGGAKLASARARLAAINPFVTLVEHPEGVTVANALELFAQYDVIVDGSDNFPTRYLNNDAAVLAGKPLVYGSVFQYEGQVSCFAPHLGGPCYRCLFPEPPQPGEVPNCDEAGVFGALCGMVGSMQAMQALNLLLGQGKPLLGRLLRIDGLDLRITEVQLARDPDCPVCGKQASITTLEPERYRQTCFPQDHSSPPDVMNQSPEKETTAKLEVTPKEAEALLRETPDAVLLDVREPFELQICKVPQSRDIPMGQIPKHIESFSKDQPIVVMCHHGGRSGMVAQMLREQGFKAVMNLNGGIEEWAEQVDPSLPRY